MRITFKAALLPEGLKSQVTFEVDQGLIQSITTNDALPAIEGLAIPGVPNVHSHAFQRAMAGRAERMGGVNSFWGWRERMYALVDRLTVDDMSAIAAMAYAEMLMAGYTAVGEFHYFHQPNGSAALATAQAMRAAARQAGIRQCLLPTLYQRGGFDGRPLSSAQARFYLSTEAYTDLVAALCDASSATCTTGIALHSLRAVDLGALRRVVEAQPGLPIHIHISEQRLEVEECVALHHKTPIDCLLDTGLVNDRWCLVHATHATEAELVRLAPTHAVVGYCVTTEANLGDGFFDFKRWQQLGGRYAVGSDSQVSIDPAEELRWMEYQRRLIDQRRPSTGWEAGTHTGSALLAASVQGGQQALGLPALAVGAPFDVVLLGHPSVAPGDGHSVLDQWVFAPRPQMVEAVWVHGQQVVAGGRHVDYPAIAARYRHVIEQRLGERP